MKAEIVTFVLAMLPISELRGAIPYGVLHGLAPHKVLILAVLGNAVPVIPLYFFLLRVLAFLSRFSLGRKFSDWLVNHARKKSRLVELYQTAGLLIFVGIPLPMTGAWTGTIVGLILGLKFRDCLIGVLAGILMAAAIVSTITFGIRWFF